MDERLSEQTYDSRTLVVNYRTVWAEAPETWAEDWEATALDAGLASVTEPTLEYHGPGEYAVRGEVTAAATS